MYSDEQVIAAAKRVAVKDVDNADHTQELAMTVGVLGAWVEILLKDPGSAFVMGQIRVHQNDDPA